MDASQDSTNANNRLYTTQCHEFPRIYTPQSVPVLPNMPGSSKTKPKLEVTKHQSKMEVSYLLNEEHKAPGSLAKDTKELRKKRLSRALEDLDKGVFKNIYSAASAYDVNYNSLKNAYYKINGKDENSQRLSTQEREKRVSRAISGFKDGKYSNLTEASKVEKVCAETVRNRYHGRTHSFNDVRRKS